MTDNINKPAPSSAEDGQAERKAKQRKLKRGPGCLSRLFGLTGVVLMITLIFLFLAALERSVKFLPVEEHSREIVVSIPEGASATRIGEILQDNKVIRSAWAWSIAVRAKGRLDKKPVSLKAGEIILDPSLSVWGNIKLVEKGNYKLYPFTVPEGRNIYEIARQIEEEGLGSQKQFLALCVNKEFISSLGLDVESLEGYLFPETYNFPKGSKLEKMIKTMTDRFLTVWKKYDKQAKAAQMSRHEVITMASIVEKETGAPFERPLIAGVFLNRLASNMPLQTDPTVIYGIENFDGNITKEHLRTAHPYNTYVFKGLPPGPISNPGEKAIEAVLNPTMKKYYYFVSKNDGTHHFSETLAEHNRMVNKYQRGNKKANKQ